MNRYAAFLRGMNVGAHRRASSGQLCDTFASAGFSEVATFRTAGNVLFSTTKRSGATIRRAAEAAMLAELGHDITVFVRPAAELHALVDAHPFRDSDESAPRGKPQVMFLLDPLDAAQERAVLAHATDADRLAVVGRAVCWSPAGGILDTGLDLTALGRIVGVTTVRTLGTVDQLVAKFLPHG